MIPPCPTRSQLGMGDRARHQPKWLSRLAFCQWCNCDMHLAITYSLLIRLVDRIHGVLDRDALHVSRGYFHS